MKPEITHHEILLFTGTGFTNREFSCRDDEKDNNRKLSSAEEMEKACWAGILCDILPELVGIYSVKNENFIWHIVSDKNFLSILMGPTPSVVENETSIDLYFYSLSACEN